MDVKDISSYRRCLFLAYTKLQEKSAEHIDAVKQKGLRLVAGDDMYVLQVAAVKAPNELVPFRNDDVVMLCAKSQHTLKCLGQLQNAGRPLLCQSYAVRILSGMNLLHYACSYEIFSNLAMTRHSYIRYLKIPSEM